MSRTSPARKARRSRRREATKTRAAPADVAAFHRDQDATRAALRVVAGRWAGMSLSDRCEDLKVTQVHATTYHGTPVLVTVSMTMQPVNPGDPNQ